MNSDPKNLSNSDDQMLGNFQSNTAYKTLTNPSKPEEYSAIVLAALKLANPQITFFECHYIVQYLKARLTSYEPEAVLNGI
jgi:hypothetical protein